MTAQMVSEVAFLIMWFMAAYVVAEMAVERFGGWFLGVGFIFGLFYGISKLP